MPVVVIFFPVPLAIAITALVHFLNNLLKLALLRKTIDWGITLKFGLPAIIAAIPGAWFLAYFSILSPFASYQIFGHLAMITPIKIVVGSLLIFFAILERKTIDSKSIYFSQKYLTIGGLVSGFFGGLSGHQGAFRAPFLLHAGLTKDQFVSTSASISTLVDTTRLIIYSGTFAAFLESNIDPIFLGITISAAFLGTVCGFLGLKKVTLPWIQRLVAILLYLLGLLLIAGVV